MTKFKNKIKILLKIILCIVIIFLIPIIITSLYIISNQGIDSFHRGLSAFFLTVLCTLLVLLICNQFKNGLVFSLDKLNFLENFIENNIIKNILKIVMKFILYALIIFLSALIIIILIDFSDEKMKIFPLESTQFLITIASISILFMLYKDLKNLYNFGSSKIKFLEEFPEKIIKKFKIIRGKILTLKLDFLKNILEKYKKISTSISSKVDNFVDLLENKICYPERNEFKDRCDFSNLRNEFEKFVKIVYQILVYLTLFSIVSIFIPLILILIYQFSMYFFTLLTTIWKVIIALIYHT
ncbi:hypothetical protein [Fusobacterium hwasookii]|uniref:Uncharacterized protein n=1 Tax=Fusobacterium hwasookii ChDC F206 TaxID=1307443 RepID=A0AAC8WKM3_9FUSO|nr:hypothetical protein [Fusobacterium hwasookii]ALQ36023.1 hypothetical protein RN92_08925 [Fusobacterium hwasookii ChDC F206]ALQ37337.1 hypothetical protein RN97_03760 [Fusobacterium hwasookii ChDC F300]QNE67712.1 hypothetical protein H5V38_07240 [Fusobacterium hwasookii]